MSMFLFYYMKIHSNLLLEREDTEKISYKSNDKK